MKGQRKLCMPWFDFMKGLIEIPKQSVMSQNEPLANYFIKLNLDAL